jgi:hypothetical protein
LPEEKLKPNELFGLSESDEDALKVPKGLLVPRTGVLNDG